MGDKGTINGDGEQIKWWPGTAMISLGVRVIRKFFDRVGFKAQEVGIDR
jgi:hypothetical protein